MVSVSVSVGLKLSVLKFSIEVVGIKFCMKDIRGIESVRDCLKSVKDCIRSIKDYVRGVESKWDVDAIFDATIRFFNAIFNAIIAGLRLCSFNTICNIYLIRLSSFSLEKFFDFLVNTSGLASSLLSQN